MHAVLSPYHLTSHDPAAYAALLLADRVVTSMPVPAAGVDRSSVKAAFRASPPYARLLESWRWAAPLFQAGVIGSIDETDAGDPLVDAGAVSRRISEEGWVAVRPFMHEGWLGQPVESSDDSDPDHANGASDTEFLDAISLDMLKGGPDPGWSLPTIGGLDALAVRRGWCAFRAGEAAGTRAGRWRTSAAQKAETALGKPGVACTLAAPVLIQASGDAILDAREVLREQLEPLRATIDAVWAGATGPGAIASVRGAAKRYSEAFARDVAEIGAAERDGVIAGMVRITCTRLPPDAALLSATAATGRPGSVPRGVETERTLRVLVIESIAGVHISG